MGVTPTVTTAVTTGTIAIQTVTTKATDAVRVMGPDTVMDMATLMVTVTATLTRQRSSQAIQQ